MWVNQQPSNIPPAEQTLPIPEPLPETLPQGQVNKKKTPSDDWEGKSHPVRRRKTLQRRTVSCWQRRI